MKKILSMVAVSLLSLGSIEAITLEELIKLRASKIVGENSDIDPSVDPIRGNIISTKKDFLYNLRLLGIESSGYFGNPENIEEEFWKTFDSAEGNESPFKLFRDKMTKGDEKILINGPATSFCDSSSNPIVQLVIELFPSAGAGLNYAGTGSFSVLFKQLADLLADKLSENEMHDLVEQLHQEIFHKNEGVSTSSLNELKQHFINDQITLFVVNMMGIAGGHIDDTERKKMLQSKMQEKLNNLNGILQIKDTTLLSTKQKNALKDINSVNIDTIKSIKDKFLQDEEIRNAIDNFTRNFTEFKEISNVNKQWNLVGQTLLLYTASRKYKALTEFLGALEPLKQKLNRVYKYIQESTKCEKDNKRIKKGEYPGKYPEGATKDIINAYASYVISDKNAQDYCEALAKIAPKQPNTQTNFLRQAYEYFQTTPVNCTPWELDKDPPTNGYPKYCGNEFPDCVETAIRMFFCFLFYDPSGNNKTNEALEILDDQSFAQFFSRSSITSIARDGTNLTRENWLQVLYPNLKERLAITHPDLFNASNEENMFFIKNISEEPLYEIQSNIKNVILAICQKMSGYKATVEDDSQKAQLQKKAEEYIANINSGTESLAVLDANKIKEIFQALVSIRPDEIEVLVSESDSNGYEITFKPRNGSDNNRAILHVAPRHSKMKGPISQGIYRKCRIYPQGKSLAEIFYDESDNPDNKAQKLKDLSSFFYLPTKERQNKVDECAAKNIIFPVGILNLALTSPDEFVDYNKDLHRLITCLAYAYDNSNSFRIFKNGFLNLLLVHKKLSIIDELIQRTGQDTELLTNTLQTMIERYGSPWEYKNLEKYAIEKLIIAGADFKKLEARLSGQPGYMLYWAIENNEPAIAQLLISKGAYINTNEDTMLAMAMRQKMHKVSKLLLQAGTTVGADKNESMLNTALDMEDEELLSLLIKRGANINAKDSGERTCLTRSVLNREPEKVKLLVGHGADINVKDKDGNTPLLLALNDVLTLAEEKSIAETNTWRSHELPEIIENLDKAKNIVSILLDKKPDLNVKNKEELTPLHYAVGSKDVSITRLLLERRADFNVKDKNGRTPLHLAVINKDIDTVKLLLEAGASIISDMDGKTPLIIAFKNHQQEIIESLISSIRDINTKDDNGQTLLYTALKYEYPIEGILEKGANINVIDNDGNTLLHYACRYSDEETLKVFLSKIDINAKNDDGDTPLHIDINAKNDDGDTPLHFACKSRNFGKVELLLLQSNIEINAKNKNGNTPLHFYMDAGYGKIKDFGHLMHLIKRGADINAQNNDGSTPLHYLCHRGVSEGNFEIFESLLNKDNVNIKNNKGETSLSIVANKVEDRYDHKINFEDVMMCLSLVSKGAEVDERDSITKKFIDNCLLQCFMITYRKANEELILKQQPHEKFKAVPLEKVELLIGKCTNVNLRQNDGDKSTLLHWAAVTKNPRFVELLLDKGAEIDAQAEKEQIRGHTPLHMAIGCTHDAETCALLISRGADISAPPSEYRKYYKTIFDEASDKLAVEIIDKLAEKISEGHCSLTALNKAAEKVSDIAAKDGYTLLLMYAVKLKASPESIGILISNGANVNIKYDEGKTSLHYYAGYGKDISILNLFLSNGLKIDEKDNAGQTPLYYATRNQNPEILQFLLDQGDDIDIKDKEGKTPLHYAACNKNPEILKCILNKKPALDINIEDNSGMTPLHYSAIWKQPEVSRLLLEKDRKGINKKDKKGNTPLYLAAEKENVNICAMLISYGADITVDSEGGIKTIFDRIKSRDFFGFSRRHENPTPKIIDKLVEKISDGSCSLDNLKAAVAKVPSLEMYQDNCYSLLLEYALKFSSGPKNTAKNIEILVSKGADINIKIDNGMTPLHYYVNYGDNTEILEPLLNKGEKIDWPDNKGKTLLHYAACNKNPKILQFLLEQGADINAKDKESKTPLYKAVKERLVEPCAMLISYGADISVDSEGGIKTIFDNDGKYGYYYENPAPKIIDKLVEKIFDGSCSLDNLKAAVAKVPSLKMYQNNCYSLLLEYALKFSSDPKNTAKNIEVLVSKGADASIKTIKNDNGMTPLHYCAAYGNNKGILEMLLNQQDINEKDGNDNTALHYATRSKDLETLRLVLEKSLESINEPNKEGMTPLHCAVREGLRESKIQNTLEMARLLISNGAVITLTDAQGKIPLNYANTERQNMLAEEGGQQAYLSLIEILTPPGEH